MPIVYTCSKICANKLKSLVKSGSKNPNWKGNKVGYIALHSWIKNKLKKSKFCQECNKVLPYDLANISGKYKRDLSDWEWLCRSCHMKKDGRMEKLNRINFLKRRKNKNCLNCKKEFYPIRNNVKHCSNRCGAINRWHNKKYG